MILNVSRSIQLDKYSCGPRSLFSVARYFGFLSHYWELKEIMKAFDIDPKPHGVHQDDLKIIANAMGMKFKRFKELTPTKIKTLLRKDKPILCAVREDTHWSVITGIDSSYIYLADPVFYRPQCYEIEDFFDNVVSTEEAYTLSE